MLDGGNKYFKEMTISLTWLYHHEESMNVLAISALNEPWVLAKSVSQCFYIKEPIKPSRVVYRRGKRSIIGMDKVSDEEDYEQFDNYPLNKKVSNMYREEEDQHCQMTTLHHGQYGVTTRQ